jgi:heptosyltransferase-1
VIRLGAMGDILHTLPAVASLKLSFPQKQLVWLVGQRWRDLLTGNPYIDEIVSFNRSALGGLWNLRRELRALRPELVIDFQGLVQSALAGRMAGAPRFLGFDKHVAREPLAARLYTERVHVTGPHRIERNLQLARAAGARQLTDESWIPEGAQEGRLPSGPYVLASPFAGWQSKQWPLEMYESLGKRLRKEGLELVINVPNSRTKDGFRHVLVHPSSLSGLIHITRQAVAVVGVDSGPLHLAAALKKPGVAIFGPTDPAQTGPFGSSMVVLRQRDVETTYKRGNNVHASMAGISVEEVAGALLDSLRVNTSTAKPAIQSL